MSRGTIALIGTEYEENLSLRYLAAAVTAAGFDAAIHAYDDPAARAELVQAVAGSGAAVVGISVPFQHRAAELLGLAADLRAAGYGGTICVGGHFATFEYAEILRRFESIDAVVRHEGEDTLLELCERVVAGRPLAGTRGLVTRRALCSMARRLPLSGDGDSDLVVDEPRPLPKLDSLSFPDRRGEPHDVVGVRAAPIVGSRGCYADCSFCCIYAYADAARGPRYRMRSVANIVAEMVEEYHVRGVRLFVFHDDNFFLPYLPKNLQRYRELAAALRAAELDDIGLVIKCRPNDVDPELFALLKSMGVIRAYIGIETNSDEGVVSLNRGITAEDNERALGVFRDLDIYCSFNVLIFDPEATLEGVEKNLDFMQRHADVPFNFCRAEVYAGTPLKAKLELEGRLRGDYLAWSYEMREPRVELLFRVATAAFYNRNFKPDGVANLNMGIRFDNETMRHFRPAAWDADFHARLVAASRDIGTSTVRAMRRALAFVREVDLADYARVNAFTLELARHIARDDLAHVARIKALRHEMETRIANAGGAQPRHGYGTGRPPWAAESARLGTSVGREISSEMLPSPTMTMERPQ